MRPGAATAVACGGRAECSQEVVDALVAVVGAGSSRDCSHEGMNATLAAVIIEFAANPTSS